MEQQIEKRINVNPRYLISRIALLTVGALFGAIAVILFLLPNQIAPTGLSGIGVILNEVTGISVGLVVILGNIPVQILAYRELFAWRAVLPTVYAVLVYSLTIDLVPTLVDIQTISDDLLLNAIFGGLLIGVGGGLIYRAGGTLGGTSSLARILRKRYGTSLSTASLFTDVIILAGVGLVFGWEAALYALIVLFISRAMSDYVLDGTGDSYTVLIISHKAKPVARAINEVLHHQTTMWQAGNAHKDEEYTLLMVSISRPEMYGLRQLVEQIDEKAFVAILSTQATYGKEFQGLSSHLPLRFDEVEDAVSRHVDSEDLDEKASP